MNGRISRNYILDIRLCSLFRIVESWTLSLIFVCHFRCHTYVWVSQFLSLEERVRKGLFFVSQSRKDRKGLTHSHTPYASPLPLLPLRCCEIFSFLLTFFSFSFSYFLLLSSFLSSFSGTLGIFCGSDVSLLLRSQIRSWLGVSLPRVNSFLTKTRKTSLRQRQGLRPFAICGLRAYERHASHRPQTANGRFSFIESWRWHKGKP